MNDRPLHRRTFLTASAAGLALSAVPRPVVSQSRDFERTGESLITPETQAAIDRGLTFLAGQQLDDGAFGAGGYARDVAICALAGMAFMSGGSTPGRGPYGMQVEKCVDFVLA